MAWIFLLRFSNLPSLEIINLSIIPKNTKNAHLFGFKLIPNFLHLWKHSLSLARWMSISLYKIKSFKKKSLICLDFFKHFIYYFLVSGKSILNPKSHNYPSENYPIYYKCCLVYLLWCYGYFMVSIISI